MIFGVNENVLTMYGTIWSGDGQEFVYWFSKLEKQYSDITIRLHTYGGSVFDGNLMCNAVERSKANITIIIDGIAASMGAVFILSGKDVKIVDNGYLMIHAPSSGSYGNAKDHESSAKLLRMMEENFVERLMARTGKTKEYVSQWLDSDTWFSAKEALKEGLVTEIIPASVETVYPAFEPEEMGEQEAYNMYACALLTAISPAVAFFEPTQATIFNDNMKQMLITALALSAVNAQSSDTAVLEAVQGKINDLEGALQKEREAKEKAETDLQNFRAEQIKAMIDNASFAKKPTDEERKVYENIGKTSGIDALALVLKSASKATAPDISGRIHPGAPGATERDGWDYDKWQKEDPKGLEKLATENPEAFTELFNAKYKK